MSDRIFVDTNILLYTRDWSESEKQPIAERWLRKLWQERCGCISVQVLHEFYVNATGKLQPGLTRAEAWEAVEALAAWEPVPLDMPLLEPRFALQGPYQLSYWGASRRDFGSESIPRFGMKANRMMGKEDQNAFCCR